MVKRKDNKGRILRDNEYQKSDGRYEYRYPDGKGGLKSVYSWRLVETDKTPTGKRHTAALRELEKTIKRDLEDGIIVQKKVTLNALWDEYIRNKTELKQSTRTNYRYMYDKYVRNVLGNMNVSAIKYSNMKNFFIFFIVEKGFKPASVEVLHTVLHPVFRIAVKDGYIRMRVWERGSGITLACGTGACACLSAAVKKGLVKPDEFVTVKLDGGTLKIKYTDNAVIMSGGAEFIAEGETYD